MSAALTRLGHAIVPLALALIAACGSDLQSPGGSGSTAASTTQLTNLNNVPAFVAAMVGAPERVAHGGLRRVEYHFSVDGIPASLVYDERVLADGQGRYSILPVAIQSPPMNAPQRELFEELQRARQGFFFKYRDLRVRDLDLFVQNYTLRVLPIATFVAGVECVELEVTPRNGPLRTYELSVVEASGLVLRTIERDAGGAVVASTTFLEFTPDPVLAGAEFHVERYPGTPLASAALTAGVAPAEPQVLPTGYRQFSSEVVPLAGTTYIRRVYGDGLENVFFLERVANAAPAHQTLLNPPNITVRLTEVGPFRVAEVVRGSGSLFVVGKISEADVLAILRSAL